MTVLQGDARISSDIENTIEDVDAVISVLGTDQTTVLTEATAYIVSEMENSDITRVITIGTAGILTSRVDSGLLRYQSSESKRKSNTAAKEHHKGYDIVKESLLDWTIMSSRYYESNEVCII